jgi:enediyne polyketide synthase
MNTPIAIVGLACLYPEARTPVELWENVLAQRQAFRRLPPERLRAEDYFSADPHSEDKTYSVQAALIEGYEFDRLGFNVAGPTFRSADLAHWVALDVASRALAEAGFPGGEGLPRDCTGVLLGNSLTGEFSRANLMRLRWPYVRRTLEAALEAEEWNAQQRAEFLERLEERYKAPFPAVGEETLAGGLSNTIAGRICNQFDLKGGGYTVDGACASSLLAVANACSSLASGDLDVALAGGVDLSIDPFELIGFAKTGALAPDLMRVYDARSAGFWPGEGCGFAVLMRHADAVAKQRRIYAVIQGWGISSDGSGGITRPEAEGQLQALRRAYRRAGYGIDTVGYFEGHGTGTNVGDATELKAISSARNEACPGAAPAVIGSIKGNIGHTKAAAGLAGLIKASFALQTQTLPPITGCEMPHALLTSPKPTLCVLRQPQHWPADRPLRASVSAMGFGGINTHITLESMTTERRHKLSGRERQLGSSAWDTELFVFSGENREALLASIQAIHSFSARISFSELRDLASTLSKEAKPLPMRAALVASSPAQLAKRLAVLLGWLQNAQPCSDFEEGIFLGCGSTPPRIGYLFPGQGSPSHLDGGIWRRCFASLHEVYSEAALPNDGDGVATEVAQPAICTASLAGLHLLSELGLKASVAVGHSLGEITALHWAGAFDRRTLLRIARVRGRAMARLGSPTGAMAVISASAKEVGTLLDSNGVSIVGFNSPGQTVISGEALAVANLAARAQARGLRAVQLPVSHAFHTPLVGAATAILGEQLSQERLTPLRGRIFSTVTGAALDAGHDLRDLLCTQVTLPVRFDQALAAAADAVDLFVEVGPGRVLSGLARESVPVPALSLDAGGTSLRGLLTAVGAAFAFGAPLQLAPLFRNRFTRPFQLDWRPKFFVNPCELAPISAASPPIEEIPKQKLESELERNDTQAAPAVQSALDLLRRLIAERAELPVSAIRDESRMLADLHLNSISVGQLVAKAAGILKLPPILGLTDFANASLSRIAEALEHLKSAHNSPTGLSLVPSGVDSWVRPFLVSWLPVPIPKNAEASPSVFGSWQIFATAEDELAEELRKSLKRPSGRGTVVLLPANPNATHTELLLEAAREALKDAKGEFLLVQRGAGAAAFAHSLHLEFPGISTRIVELPHAHPQAVEWINAELSAPHRHSHVRYRIDGIRCEPFLEPLIIPQTTGEWPIGPEDVLLVTGGGKGIAAECALALGSKTGARLVLLGRSDPSADPELAANLQRFESAGVRCRYYAADVGNAEAVRSVLAQAQREVATITAFVHAAGANVPKSLAELDQEAFLSTLAPKVNGARNVLAALAPERLRLFITFSSIIGRAGLQGEADYAVANEWLTRLTEDWRSRHSHCRCMALEWSVWSGVGMGARLGRIESLRQQGISPITPEAGVEIFEQLLRAPALPEVAVVVTGRFGEWPALKLNKPELPFLRFLEKPQVFYPGVELVVDSVLSCDSDPYLEEHVYHGERLFPAVMGLEAMAQASMALMSSAAPPCFEEIRLVRPVVVPKGGTLKIRLAALMRAPGLVEVVLRSDETGLQMDHFRALCRFESGTAALRDSIPASKLPFIDSVSEQVPLDPLHDIYEPLLFHKGRFQRILNYRSLSARECLVELEPDTRSAWFSSYLPQERILGDSGVRDAAIHAIQACIPHARLLPAGVQRLQIGKLPCLMEALRTSEKVPELLLHAREVAQGENTFIFDLELLGSDGSVLEKWEGLELRRVENIRRNTPWPAPLLGPYLERRLEELLGSVPPSVLVLPGASTEEAARRLLDPGAALVYRADGKPEVSTGAHFSASRAQGLTFAISGSAAAACDVEVIVSRSTESWREVLGSEHFRLAELMAQQEHINVAATRVWTAIECLKKVGAMQGSAITLTAAYSDGWQVLRSGRYRIATCRAEVQSTPEPIIFSVLS